MQVRKKLRRIKRFAYLGALIGAIITVRRARQQRAGRAAPLGPPATWPPLHAVAEEPVAARGDIADDADRVDAGGQVEAAASGWVPPGDDGGCPLSHPIKANDNSMIFHQPGGRFYERTRAERCYADAASAEADGYRAAKGAGRGAGYDQATGAEG